MFTSKVKSYSIKAIAMALVLGAFLLSGCSGGSGAKNDGLVQVSLDSFASSLNKGKSASTKITRNATVGQTYEGELLAKSLTTGVEQTFQWYATLEDDSFNFSSTKTIALAPDQYELTLLLTRGDYQYAGKVVQSLADKDEIVVDLQVSPVVGELISDATQASLITTFDFNYDLNDMNKLADPKLTFKLNSDNELNFDVNPTTGLGGVFVNVPEGDNSVEINLFDGTVQMAKSKGDFNIVAGSDLDMDLTPLLGEFSFDLDSTKATLNLKILLDSALIETTGSIANTRSVIKVIDNETVFQTKEFTITEDNGSYSANIELSDLTPESTISLSVEFFDITKDYLAGKLNIEDVALNSLEKNVTTAFEVYKQGTISGNLLASLSLNVFAQDQAAQEGVSIYLNDNFIGLTNDGSTGAKGYFQAFLTKGTHTIKAVKGNQEATLTFDASALEIINKDLVLAEVNNTINPNAFIIKVDTTKSGVSSTTEYKISTDSSYTYNYSVDCNNDGTNEIENATGDYTCSYANSGEYEIAINGIYPKHGDFNDGAYGDNQKIIIIKQWGNIEWKEMSYSFIRASNMNLNATDTPNLTNVTNMRNMFSKAIKFNANIENWDMSNVTNISSMFFQASTFNQSLDNWDTSNVTDMAQTFTSATSFNQNLNNWDTSNVTNMSYMFNNATSFNGNISSWNVSNVIEMKYMFDNATSFNGNISSWNVSNVQNMYNMFYNASVFNNDIGSWNVSNVLTFTSTFEKASSFNQDIGSWDINALSVGSMFKDATSFNQDLTSWTISPYSISDMFTGATAMEESNKPSGL